MHFESYFMYPGWHSHVKFPSALMQSARLSSQGLGLISHSFTFVKSKVSAEYHLHPFLVHVPNILIMRHTFLCMQCWKAGKRLGTTLTCALLPISCVSRSAITVEASTSIDAECIRTIAWITTITFIDICSKLTTKPINYNIHVSDVL